MAHQHRRQRHPFRAKAISVAVGACFSVSVQTVLAAPTGATVVSGTATVNQQGNLTTVTNSPGAVINWQAFSIGANEITRFIQQSAASSVLNRVVGVDPSIILGVLQSNGRVLLINPNGIVFGAGAQIDVAGLVASSLNLSNADFAAGRLRFTDTPGAGSVNNQGAITTPTGGQVYLIAPNVQNSGIITSPQGEIILAAGRSVDLVDAGTPNLRIEITAPDTEAINIGQIIARSGKIGIYAALVKNSGEIRADGVVVGANGEILLRAKHNVSLENGSVISASGPTAGKITIQAETGAVAVAGRLEANATQGKGGTISIAAQQGVNVLTTARITANGTEGGSVSLASAAGSVTVAAPVTATATSGRAGQIAVSAASTVTLASGAQLSASGGVGGGTVSVKGASGVTFDSGSTVQASGAAGGTVSVQTDDGAFVSQGTIEVSGADLAGGSVDIAARYDITLDITSRILANGRAGGQMRMESTAGTLLSSGLIEGRGSNGPGGLVYLLAPRVALFNRAVVDVSGDTGGGVVLVGGDYQGKNLHIQNASRTYFGPDAIIHADAITSGDGGKVIVWSEDGTQAYGTISARGGALSGNGGFVETSGKAWLDFGATVNTTASHGAAGTLLLDPYNLTIQAASPDINGDSTTGDDLAGSTLLFGTFAGATSIITAGAVNTQLNAGNVILQASNDLTVNAPITTATPGRTLTLQAGAAVNINADITTTTGNISITANDEAATGARGLGNGGITMAPGTTITAGTAMVFMRVGAGAGGGQPSGDIVVANIVAQDVNVQQDGRTAGNASILRASPASLITARNLLLEVDHGGTAANGSIGTTTAPIRIAPYGATTINFESHAHELSPGIFIDAPVASTDLIIGGVPFFGGGVRGVQTVSGGPIEITVNGKLSQAPGTAPCGFMGGGTGGPICAGGGAYNPGDTVFLRADDMDLQKIISGRDVYLAPKGAGNIKLGSAGTGGGFLHLSSTELAQVSSFTLNVGEQDVSGDVSFAGDLTTPGIFGIRTGGSITSGANTLTVGATGDGNIDIYAKTGIQLNVKAATLSAYNVTSGNINIAETSAGGGALILDFGTAPFSNSLRNDAAAGDIILTTTNRAINVVNSITSQRDLTLTSGGGDIIIGSPSNAVLVNAGQDIFVNASGVLSIQAGNTTLGSGAVRDMSAKVRANRDVSVNAAGVNVSAGTAISTGSVVGENTKADAELTAGRDMTLTAGVQGVYVTGGIAQVLAASGDVYSADANAKLAAVGNLTMTIAGGGLTVSAGQASATAQSGIGAMATANANTVVSAGAGKDLSITVSGGNININGGNAQANAFHNVSGSNITLAGDNNATANADISLSAGNALAIVGGNLTINGGRAFSSAYKAVAGTNNMLAGDNTATANSNITLSGASVTLDLGAGSLYIRGSSARARSYHGISGGNGNVVGGDHAATANSNISLTASSGALTVNATGGVSIYGSSASASAYKRIYNGNSNMLSGNHSATANSNISLSGASVMLDLGAGSLYISGSGGGASAYHYVYTGNGNVLSGNHTATANSNISLTATSGPLTVNATGGVTIYGSYVGASAHKYVYGNNNTLSGNNTATANSNISLTGASLTFSLGTGSLYVSGGSASASAYHTVSGNTNNVSGNHAATANSNINLTATSGALTVAATGGVTIYGSSAEASAYKYVSGSNHTVSGTNTATANSNISLSGAGVTLNLGAGGLYISAGSASAEAYHYLSGGNGNTLSGDHVATATSNISLNAASGALTVNATGGVTIYGSSASASVYKRVNVGNNHTLSGNLTATANSNISLAGASVALNLGSGSLYISGSSAEAVAYHYVNGGSGNNLGGNHAATANSNISLTATSGALTVNATGGVTISGSSASAIGYKYVSGNGHTVSGNNTATANSNISLSGTSVALNLSGGSLTINGSSASARAYHQVSGDNNVLSGAHNATANSNITINATSGNLTIGAGSIAINGDSASARAYMSVNGNGNTIGIAGPASNTAAADATIRFTATGNQTITVAGGIAASASISASAYAYHRINYGTGNNLSGNNTANANNGLIVTAGGTLTLAAGSLDVGGNDASASAYKSIFGNSSAPANTNQITGNNSATGSGLIKFGGSNINVSLTGSLGIYGSYVSARAYNQIFNFSNNNILSGTNMAKAAANVLFAADTALSIAAGSMTARASSADATVYNSVGGGVTGNTVSGGNTAMADTNVRLSATNGNLIMNVGAGSMLLQGGSASAHATNTIDAGNTVAATNAGTAHANVLVAASGNMMINVTSGNLTVQGDRAIAGTSGAGTNLADANANAGVFALGAKSVNVSNTAFLSGGSATATGTGATASAFAMLDPGSLDLTANLLTLTPNSGGVIMSAMGPINLTIGGVSTPLSSYAAAGNLLGTGTLISGDPIVVDIGGTSVDVSARFGLPAAFLSAGPGVNVWTGLAGDFLWSSGGNWSLGHEPNSFEIAQIADLSGTPTISILSGSHTPKAFQFFGDDIFSVSGGSLTFANASSISNGIFSIGGGTVNANAALTAKTLNLTGGALNGTGSLTVTNSFSQTGGTIGSNFSLIDITQAAGNLAISNSLWAGAIKLNASAGNIDVQDAAVTSTGTMDITASNNLNLTAVNGPAILESTGMQTINANGIFVQGASSGSNRFASIRSFGGQNITAGAGGIWLTGGGGTGNSNSADIFQTSAGNPQLITVNGGGTVQVAGGSGSGGNNFAYIWNQSTGSPQTINFTAGGALNLLGGTVGTGNSALLENDAGMQTIMGNAAIQVAGGNSGTGNYGWLFGKAGQNISASGITLTGGTAGSMNSAAIEQQGAASNQTITINGAGTVSLTGGGGTQNQAEITNLGKAQSLAFTAGGMLNLQGGSGAGGQNRAALENQGAGATTQTVTFTGGGAVNLTGGTAGPDNNAEIHAFTGNQTVTGNANINLTGGASGGGANSGNDASISLKLGAAGVQTINAGNISLNGGAGGTENGALFSAETSGQTQIINATGSVTLNGGGGSDAVAAIASNQGNVNITVNAGGPVTLTGGSGGFSNYGAIAAIGAVGGFNANVTINVQAGITLNKGAGPGANAFVGTDSGTPTLTLKAGLGGAANLALNDGLIGNLGGPLGNITLQANNGNITQTTGGIRANNLALSSSGNVSLAGANDMATVNITSANSATINDINNIGLNAASVAGSLAVTAPGTISINGALSGNSVALTSTAGSIIDPSASVITAPTITLSAASGVNARVNNNGTGLNVVNSATGDVFLTSTAPLFTVGGGGATFSNAAAGGGYYITAQNNMVLNAGAANNRQALFGAGGMLTVNGYTNASGMGVLMVGNNVAFNGATNVSGALGVIGNNIGVNTTVQGGSVNVVAGALNVNGGDFQSTAGNFVGTVTGDVNVAGGGRIYGNPDVNLTVGGTIFINGANSRIEAFSPTSIRVLFPLLASGGYQINGAAGTVWDALTNTGFYAGGLPAVLGGSLQITYGAAGLPPSVIAAINTTVAATNKSADADSDNKDKDKDKDANKEKTDKDEKSIGGNLKMQCN